MLSSMNMSGTGLSLRNPTISRTAAPVEFGRGQSVSSSPPQAVAVRSAIGNGGVLKSKGPVIMELPLSEIRRPLLRTRTNDPQKVKELMDSIAEIGLQEPIDILEVEGRYYGFSGCHRFEAHQKLGLPTIRCKIRRGTKETLRGGMSEMKGWGPQRPN